MIYELDLLHDWTDNFVDLPPWPSRYPAPKLLSSNNEDILATVNTTYVYTLQYALYY